MQINWSNFHSAYTKDEVRKYVPTDAGVYLLCVKLAEDDKWKCFYVGQAMKLEERLVVHISNTEENECIKKKVSSKICGFVYAEVSKQGDRDGMEKFLYDHCTSSKHFGQILLKIKREFFIIQVL